MMRAPCIYYLFPLLSLSDRGWVYGIIFFCPKLNKLELVFINFHVDARFAMAVRHARLRLLVVGPDPVYRKKSVVPCFFKKNKRLTNAKPLASVIRSPPHRNSMDNIDGPVLAALTAGYACVGTYLLAGAVRARLNRHAMIVDFMRHPETRMRRIAGEQGARLIFGREDAPQTRIRPRAHIPADPSRRTARPRARCGTLRP